MLYTIIIICCALVLNEFTEFCIYRVTHLDIKLRLILLTVDPILSIILIISFFVADTVASPSEADTGCSTSSNVGTSFNLFSTT